jgi:hypothetical protein
VSEHARSIQHLCGISRVATAAAALTREVCDETASSFNAFLPAL